MFYIVLIFLVLGILACVASCFLEHYSDKMDNEIMKNSAWVVLFVGVIFFVCMAVFVCFL